MRYLSIELLRAVAIILMVQVHFVENLSGVVGLAPTGFAAPLFVFLSGMSYRLWYDGRKAKGDTERRLTIISFRRGLFLIVVGFLFNIFVWTPTDVFNWDVLTFIGSALILLTYLRFAPTPVLLVIIGVIYGISPLLRIQAEYAEFWTNNYYEYDFTFSDVTLGYLVTGYFPLFPWLIFPIAGYLTGSAMFPTAHRQPQTKRRLIILGVVAAFLSAGLVIIRRTGNIENNPWLSGWTMFPASSEYIAGSMAIILIGFTVTYTLVDEWQRLSPDSLLARIATTFSRHSFTAYLLHHVVHLWPLWIMALLDGQEITSYWQKAMTYPYAWALAFAYLIASYFLLRLMDRYRIAGIEGLMRRMCD